MDFFYSILVRYLILILAPLGNLFIFYFIFTPLTLYLSYFLIKIFFVEATIYQNFIFFGQYTISMIPACVAGSAYYLLLILNLSTPKIVFKKRILILFTSFLILLILNSLRVFILALLLNYNISYFNTAHLFFWYLLSTLFVVGVWFLEVKLFKIEEIPFYTDIIKIKKLLYKK